MKTKFLFFLITVSIGIAVGGYLFSSTQRRTFLKLKNCTTDCLDTKELFGMLASVGVRYGSNYFPEKVYETDKTVAIKHPTSKIADYLIIPKKDIKNIAEVSEDDRVYLLDAMAVAERIITDKKLSKYQLVTNGPGYQDVTYLHFHLVGE